MNELTKWKVTSTTYTKNIDDIVSDIKKGYKGVGGIRLKPFYQRDYKFTVEKESSVIESLLLGIPIPMIHLSSDIAQDVHINNVIDGQHRLYAIYRYVNDEFRLARLKLVQNIEEFKNVDGKKFSQLPKSIQNKLLYQTSLEFQSTHVQDNPRLELEIFTRYNQGTNPLTEQEIRTVVYHCPFNVWVYNELIPMFIENPVYQKMYNAQGKRLSNKKLHEQVFILYAIHKYGLIPRFNDSPDYADEIMFKMRKLNDDFVEDEKQKMLNFFADFTDLYTRVAEEIEIEYPCSKELLGEERSDKFHTSIALAMVSIYNYLIENDIPRTESSDLRKIAKSIEVGLIRANFLNPGQISSTAYRFQLRGLKEVVYELKQAFNLQEVV
ncbi:MAG: hypothetical protein K0R18_101 [Bacillales bacterium]|jgi:hypothetical protein|nr:hypothetical protein [Bacillales bacterium]